MHLSGQRVKRTLTDKGASVSKRVNEVGISTGAFSHFRRSASLVFSRSACRFRHPLICRRALIVAILATTGRGKGRRRGDFPACSGGRPRFMAICGRAFSRNSPIRGRYFTMTNLLASAARDRPVTSWAACPLIPISCGNRRTTVTISPLLPRPSPPFSRCAISSCRSSLNAAVSARPITRHFASVAFSVSRAGGHGIICRLRAGGESVGPKRLIAGLACSLSSAIHGSASGIAISPRETASLSASITPTAVAGRVRLRGFHSTKRSHYVAIGRIIPVRRRTN